MTGVHETGPQHPTKLPPYVAYELQCAEAKTYLKVRDASLSNSGTTVSKK
jgi:hypothetical protein